MRARSFAVLATLVGVACSEKATGNGSTSSGAGAGGASASSASSSGGASGGPASCMLLYANRNCQSALEASCCGESSTCKNNPDCFALASCLEGCPKPRQTSCTDSCYTSYGAGGGNDLKPFASCVGAHLGSDCQLN